MTLRSRTARVIVHHSAGSDTETVAAIRRFHVGARGYADIGYHWIVRRSTTRATSRGPWTCEEGRDERMVGSHDADQNSDSVGVCILGSYDKGPVPADGWAVLVATVADVCRRYGLTADAVEGHGEHEPRGSATACPGFDPALLRAAVAEQLRRVA
jgi:N-acetylmuramoyl-L-alanine amidase